MLDFRFTTHKVRAIVSSILHGDIVQCILVISLLINKAQSLLTAWGRVLCSSATTPPPGMNCFAGLVNRWSISLWSRDRLRSECRTGSIPHCERHGVAVEITSWAHDQGRSLEGDIQSATPKIDAMVQSVRM